jgi:hypothetical protein
LVLLSLSKQIKCVRCHGVKIVPSDWQYRECKPCHDRTVRRRQKGKIPIERIEQKAIGTLLDFEQAWQNYRRFCREWKMTIKPKEEFQKEWLSHNQQRIEAIKKVIEKYNDSRCPILSYTCLEFRRLFSVRLNYVNTEDFSINLTKQESDLFYNHLSCPNCNQYQILHKYDAPIELNLNEEGVSQKEFEGGIDDFFEAMRGQGDPVDDAIAKMGFKPACGNCGSQLVNGECPKGCSNISPFSNISREYDRRPQQQEQQPQEVHNPLQEKLQRDYDEGKKETERINKLPERKIKQFLEQPDNDQ